MSSNPLNYQPIHEARANNLLGPSQEKPFTNALSGFCALLIAVFFLLLIPVGVLAGVLTKLFYLIPLIVTPAFLVFLFSLLGLVVVNPGQAVVMTFCGKYYGTLKTNGFFWVNPLTNKNHISLRINNIESRPLKCNDKQGNPIEIGIVLAYRVQDTFRASFDVENYMSYVYTQIDAAIRKLAAHYSYDNFLDDVSEVTLRSGGEEVQFYFNQNDLTEENR